MVHASAQGHACVLCDARTAAVVNKHGNSTSGGGGGGGGGGVGGRLHAQGLQPIHVKVCVWGGG